MVFFAIWWAWVNFTWFASAYDVDDLLYRLFTFVQIVGVLILAAGVESAFTAGNFTIMTIGYVVMRVAMVAQWLRAAAGDPAARPAALRVRGRHQHPAGRLGAAPVPPAGRSPVGLLRPGASARCSCPPTPSGRSARRRHAVAPRAHHRAVRAVHPDRARGVHRRGDGGAAQREPVARRLGRAGGGGRRRRAPRLLHLVVVLREPGRGGAAHVAANSPSSGATATTSSSGRSARWAPGSQLAAAGSHGAAVVDRRRPRRGWPWPCRWRRISS